MSECARVLVVDDDAWTRDIVRRLLGQARMCVRTYASATEFLECADMRTHAVLLLDVAMPGMSGLQLQTLLRERRNALPIVFLTGTATVAIAVAAMRDGAVDFIEKPFEAADLVARVDQAFTRRVEPVVAHRPLAGHGHHERLASLTPREREVLHLMVTGRTSKAMARELGGSFRTIEIHRSRVMAKMAAASLADLVRLTFVADGEA